MIRIASCPHFTCFSAMCLPSGTDCLRGPWMLLVGSVKDTGDRRLHIVIAKKLAIQAK